MNIFRDRSLRRLAAYILAGMFLIFLAEYLIIQNKIETLEEIEEKKDFARGAQLKGQQIAFLVEQYTNDEKTGAEILARISEQEQLLKTLGNGGRIHGSSVFLQPLSRLPHITYDNLYENWSAYKQNVTALVTDNQEEKNDNVPQTETQSIAADSLQTDSLSTAAVDTSATQPVVIQPKV
jgi:hypothetical protein